MVQKKFYVGAFAGLFLACSPSTKAEQRPCATDMDCPGQELCLEGICTGGSCVKDTDCPGDQLCENGYCTGLTKEPQAVFDEFVSVLGTGDLSKTIEYLHPQSRQAYEQVLSGDTNLSQEFQGYSFGETTPVLAQKLKGVTLTLKEEFGTLRDYSYPCADRSGETRECILRFKQDENGSWKIKNF